MLASVPSTPFPFGDNPLIDAGFWTARMTAVKVIGRYLGLLMWPAQFSFDYSFNENPLFGWGWSAEDLKAVFALLVCVASAIAAVVCWRRRQPVFFGIAFFFATLSPTSNLVIRIGSIMAERFLYLPSVGFAVLVVYAAQWVSQRLTERQPAYRNAIPVAVGVLLFGFAARTYARNGDWVDQGRFWRSAVEAAPGSYKTNLSAANNTVFLTQQDWDRALAEMGRALAILDPLPDLENVGIAYQQAGVFYRNLGLRWRRRIPRAAAKQVPNIGIASRWTRCCGARGSNSRRTKGIARKTPGAASPGSPSCRARFTCRWAALTKSWETGSGRWKHSNAGARWNPIPTFWRSLRRSIARRATLEGPPWRWWRRWPWIPGGRDWRPSLWNYTRKSTRRAARSAMRAERAA